MEKDEIQENDDSLEEETVEEDEEGVEDTDSEEESGEDSDVDYKAEAAKWKAIAQRKKKRKPLPEKEIDDDIVQDVKELKLLEKKRRFGYEHGLSPEEADKVFKIDPNPTEDTLKDPFVKAGLQAIKRQKDVKNNIPSSSSSSKPFTQKDFRSLSPEDKQKEFEKYMRSKSS